MKDAWKVFEKWLISLVPMLRITAIKLRGQTLQSPGRDGRE